MKRTTFFAVLLSFFCISAFGQSQESTIYKADQWANIEEKGSWAKAMENPIKEDVEIIISDTIIKATFGSDVRNYKIISESRFSAMRYDYKVKRDEETYTLSITNQPNGTYAINIEGKWMVFDITDKSTLDVE
ncbi:MAG: hypothetical protein WD016_04775 [Balneolaceae bacterium]